MNLATHTDTAQRITTYYDPAAPAPARFLIWFENRKVRIIAETAETSAATWQRVVTEVQRLRQHFRDGAQKDMEWKRPGYFRGNPDRHAHVFAGIDMPEELRLQLFKRWAVWWFEMMSCEARNPDHDSRVAALTIACKLDGLDTPQRAQVHIRVLQQEA